MLAVFVISVGTCGFGVSQSRAMLELAVVEIQRTFYRPVAVATARRWREKAPAGFEFAVKASQFITHEETVPTYRRSGLKRPLRPGRYGSFRETEEVKAGWEATLAVADVLRASAILFQCPPSFTPAPDHVRSLYHFFESIATTAAKVWEPRGPWASHLIDKVCADLDLVHCVDPFAAEPVTAGLAYFRLHGTPPGPRTYDYTYTDPDLERLLATCREYDDAFVLFNNVSAHSDALRFSAMLGSL